MNENCIIFMLVIDWVVNIVLYNLLCYLGFEC